MGKFDVFCLFPPAVSLILIRDLGELFSLWALLPSLVYTHECACNVLAMCLYTTFNICVRRLVWMEILSDLSVASLEAYLYHTPRMDSTKQPTFPFSKNSLQKKKTENDEQRRTYILKQNKTTQGAMRSSIARVELSNHDVVSRDFPFE